MKLLLLIAFLFISPSGLSAEGRSLNELSDLTGSWSASERVSDDEWVVSMEVTESGEVTVKQTSHYEGYEIQTLCKSAIDQVKIQDDLFVFFCENTKVTKYKVVVGGRQFGELKQLFGMLYYYSHGQIWKSLKVEIEQRTETDNKSLNADTGDAGAG
ncbi:MAG: hypothetical protein OQJ84_02140 [Xanthomonadales bacterium]|nr:hypothetical protein [Xanthomonadales bacterium]